MDLAASSETDLLLGTIDEENGDVYNAALLVSDGGERVQVYRRFTWSLLANMFPGARQCLCWHRLLGIRCRRFSTGKRTHGVYPNQQGDSCRAVDMFRRYDWRIDQTICPSNRDESGANLLVDMTNDGWFQHSAGSHQHLANAIFRCVETRRPMLRAANTGVTCFINQFGRINQELRDETGNTFTEGCPPVKSTITDRHQPTFLCASR